MSTAAEREAVRERVRRFRERKKEEDEAAIRAKFASAFRERSEAETQTQPSKEDFAAQQSFLQECDTAVAVLIEADAFLLWTLYPAQAYALGVPQPSHTDAANVDDANAFVESFAAEYEQSQWKKSENRWAQMLRLILLDGLSVDQRICDCVGVHDPKCEYASARVFFHISPGYRDLYKQYCKHLGKPVPTEFTKPAPPEVPSKKMVEVEDRFLARMKALDKGFALGVGGIDWTLMKEEDAKALWFKFQEFCGNPVEQPTPAEVSAEAETIPEQEPKPITRIGEFSVGSIVQKKGGGVTTFTITGFQDDSNAIVSFHDEDNRETVGGLVLPLNSLALLMAAVEPQIQGGVEV